MSVSGSNAKKVMAAVVLGALCATGAGCWYPGGSGFSTKSYTYESTEYSPKSVTLIDTRTSQAIWTYDVPVGRKLVFKIYPGAEDGNYLYPDLMKWDVWEIDRHYGDPMQRFLVPPENALKVDWRLRPVPEFATPPVK